MRQFTRTISSALLTAAALVIAPIAASADTLATFTFNQFNPGSNGIPPGTVLTSVAINLSGTVTVADPDDSSPSFLDGVRFTLTDNLTGSVLSFFLPVGSSQSLASNLTQLGTTALAAWTGTGTGTYTLTDSFSDPDDAVPDITLTINQVPSAVQTYNGTFSFGPVSSTPLPAALPLFATGLAGLGLLGWRRKRKAQAVA